MCRTVHPLMVEEWRYNGGIVGGWWANIPILLKCGSLGFTHFSFFAACRCCCCWFGHVWFGVCELVNVSTASVLHNTHHASQSQAAGSSTW